MKKVKLQKLKSYSKVTEKLPLRVLADVCLIEEFPIEAQADTGTGLTTDVVNAIKGGSLIIPDSAQYALEKFPFQGNVMAIGKDVKEVKVGNKVLFARLGGMRWQEGDKQVIAIKEQDVLAILC